MLSDTPRIAELFHGYVDFLQRAGKPSAATARWVWKGLAPHFAHRTRVDADLCLSYAKARRGAGVADSTIWAELSRLRAALAHAQRNGAIVAIASFWKPGPPRARERWLTQEEARRLIAAAFTARHVRLFIILALATAGREAALLQLTWDRVDLERGLIDLDDPERSLTSKRRAAVPINAMARVALERAKARARSRFVIEYGGRPVRCVWAGVRAAADRAGLTGVSPHTLRHTAGMLMIQAGVPLLTVAGFMGISIATAAKSYLKVMPKQLADAAAAVDLGYAGNA
jgi:integrase